MYNLPVSLRLHRMASDPALPATDSRTTDTRGQMPPGLTAGEVRASLDAILVSPAFSQSRRLGTFLRFVVEQTAEGRGADLKEYLIGVEVFQRKRSYDPRTDPIVRVEAGRLRKKLAEYYETDGRLQSLRIDLPKGGYAPQFHLVQPAPPQAEPDALSENAKIQDPKPADPAAPARSTHGWAWASTIGVAAALAISIGVYWVVQRVGDQRKGHASSGKPGDAVSIAVLPFADLSPGADQAYFADGLTEELIGALARLKDLRVAPRGSTARLSGVNRDVRQIGRELNVTAVLDGSVRRSGDRLRIAVRVSDVAKGYTLWSEMYERHVSDIFAVQEDISQKIVRAIAPQLGVASAGRVMRAQTTNVKAFQLYLKGRYHWNRRNEDSLRKAIAYFEEAIQEDPRYAAAYSGLADAYGGLPHQTTQAPGQFFSRGKAAALKALEIDRDLPEAHASLGRAQLFDDWDFAAAEKSFRRALEIDPQYATAYQWYAVLLMLANRSDEALAYMRRAEELEPLHPNIKRAAGDLQYRRGDYDAAIQKCREAVELDSRFDSAYICLGRSYELKGDYAQARRMLANGRAISNRQDLFVSLEAHLEGVAGKPETARKLLEELRTRSRTAYVSPYYFAVASAGLGEKQQAVQYLQKALAERSVWIIGLATDVRFNFLRGDPRFEAILRNLPS